MTSMTSRSNCKRLTFIISPLFMGLWFNGMGLGKVGSPFRMLKQNNNKELPKEMFQSSSSTWFNLQNDCPSANLWPNFS